MSVSPLLAQAQPTPVKVRRPIRLVSRAEIPAAGNYREIPLADAPEAALSERASDVLQKQTGVQVNRAGAPGTQSLLGLRGSTPEQVEYFIEDMPLPKPLNTPLNLESLPLPLFRAVEIYPSFIPSHLPAANIGGALNFRLRLAEPGKTEYLTQATLTSLQGYSQAAARMTDTSLHFVNFEQSRNSYRYTSNNGTPENGADDVVKRRHNEDFARIGYTGWNEWRPGLWRLKTLVDVSHAERGLPGTQNMPLDRVRRTDDRAAVSLSARRPVTQIQSIQLFSSATLDASRIDDVASEMLFLRQQKNMSPQFLGGISYAFRSENWDAGLHARGRFQQMQLDQSFLARRAEGQAMASIAYDHGFFRLAGQGGGTAGEDTAAAGAFYASQEKKIQQVGASGSVLGALRPVRVGDEQLLEIYGQVSSSYRAPSLYERFGDNVFVTPSENLKAEQALTNAGGIKGVFPCGRQFSCSLRSEAWLTGARDYILFTQNSARTMIAVNASSAQIWGVENEALFSWPGRMNLALRYTWLDARDYGNIPYYQDRYLPLRPRHHAVATLTLVFKSIRLIGTLEYRGAVFRDRYNSYAYYLRSKTLADAGIDYIVEGAARHTFNFTVKNITDNQDVDLIGYTVPGRYVLVKWTAQW